MLHSKNIGQTKKPPEGGFKFGGPKRDRTVDLNTASVALSQLSYEPELKIKIVLIYGNHWD